MGFEKADRKDLKNILLREGIVFQDVLNQTLTEQERTRKPFLELLIRTGQFDSKKLASVLSRYYGCPLVNPGVFVIERELIDLIPSEYAEKYLVLPISRLQDTLTVAFADPTRLDALENLHAITGLRIKVAVADAQLLKTNVKIYYGEGAAAEGEASSPLEGGQNLDDIMKLIEIEKQEEGVQDSENLMKEAFETPVIKLVNMLLTEGIRRRASDIFIEPWERYVRVRARVDGLLEEVVRPQKSLGAALVSRIKIMSDLNIAEHRIPQDGRFKVKVKGREVDMRISILPTTFGEKVCIRILDTKSQSHEISRLGFSVKEQRIIQDSARRPHGMILVTGPTGSGKTTTLYSVLKYLDSPAVNITTVEDPVEYQLPGINQVHVRENIGLTFPAALRSILRQDPDIILIGEIRDMPTLDIAVKAALTGHLVLSTLHTNDAASSVTRMLNMGLEPFLIASTVVMISAQRLVRRLCTNCRCPEDLKPDSLAQLGIGTEHNPVFYKGRGCPQCRRTGYSGRTVVTEILPMTPEIRERIMRGATAEAIKAYAREQGMSSLRECAIQKALEGETSLEEVFRVTSEDSECKAEEDMEDNPAYRKAS